MEAQDSIGAKILIKVKGVGPGLGAPVFSKLDAELAKAVMSVNAVKAFEIGVGADVVTMRGSENNDEISKEGFKTNNSGGILGGISNGEDIDVFASIKPTSSISKNSKTVDIKNEEVDIAIKGRHDPCVGLRATPILESMVAITVLDQHLVDRAQCGDVKRD
jgi:chorismate synthase